jgi:hypothetical protein
MTQKDKELLLKDLCARLPYKPKIKVSSLWNKNKEVEEDIVDTVYCVMPDGYINTETIDSDIPLDDVVLYLRPLSSMSKDENNERKQLGILCAVNSNRERIFDGFENKSVDTQLKSLDWLNAHHFDYRGLIPKGLALEAPEGMYKF